MKLTAKAGVSFIKGKFDLVLDITDKKASEHITLKGKRTKTCNNTNYGTHYEPALEVW